MAEKYVQRDSTILETRLKLEKFTKDYINSKDKSDNLLIIPVVFHVVHNYGTENISKAQILDEIRIINNNYQKRNFDTAGVESEFVNLIANCKIEFRLARIDPNGNCTEGITRTASTSTYRGDNDTKLIAPSWDRSKYLNVWVVKKLESGAAGFSNYPSDATVDYDGVILLSDYVGSIGTSSYNLSKTLTHEVGHYLNLRHTWGNSNDPALPGNCNDDDGVSDTPNTIGHLNCDLGSSTCGSHDNVQNYMEYSYCTTMFTIGQKDRMRAALASNIANRNNLWTQSNLIATGTNDGYVPPQCAPIPYFIANSYSGCIGTSIDYTGYSYNSDVVNTWNWSFPGGTPSSSTLQNPTVIYNTSGTYNVSLTVGNSSGSNQLTKNNIIKVYNTTTNLNIPYSESFDLVNFPNYYTADTLRNWIIEESGNETWKSESIASASSGRCIIINNTLNASGTVNSIISPNITLNQNPNTKIYFKHAYARRDATTKSTLKVYISIDCGNTWLLRFSKYNSALATNGGGYVGNFYPTSDEWRLDSVTLGTYYNNPNIRIKIESTSGVNDCKLYIDDFTLPYPSKIDDSNTNINNISIVPNPFNIDSKINLDLNRKSNVTISIYDIIGNKLGDISRIYNQGINTISISEFVPNIDGGIYFVKAIINNEVKTLKVICIK